ncbi:phytanoyl-CoA dioxygenase family protein [Pedobacter sp.]|uniref:phytanoyl-CoA dioxygenase family protein n=1 Tax=Pedobacter sp. TaxID=1411316 RepID=UPI003BACC344
MKETIEAVDTYGFSIVDGIFSSFEVNKIIDIINQANPNKQTFRKSADLFAIRRFLKELPSATEYIFNPKLRSLISTVFGEDYFLVKSIYFDKPESSNWFVSYHQDLTISVDQIVDLPGFGPYTTKPNQFAVQPPLPILKDNFTLRIHLDDTDEGNGALKVIPGSHHKGIYKATDINWNTEQELSCNVASGGVMIMKPLLLHSSGRTTNNKKRRVIHLEFSKQVLPEGLNWAELYELNQ